jgi:hypothetical protein
LINIQCGGSFDLPTPTFSPPPGEYSEDIDVILAVASPGAQIHYTLDGSIPECGVSNLYTSPIPLLSPTLPDIVVRAIACNGSLTSAVASSVFRITNGVLGSPTVTPTPGTYTSDTIVEIFPPGVPGSFVRYTTNGTNPNCGMGADANPFNIGQTTVLKAIACNPDWTSSTVVEFLFTIDGTVAIPGFSWGSNTFNNDVTLSLTIATPSSTIRYTSQVGSDPPDPTCATGTVYSTPIALNTNDTRIKAIGCRAGWNPSVVSPMRIYQFQVATPTISPTGQIVTSSVNITGSSTTTGSTVYLGDGTEPPCSGSTSINLAVTGGSDEVSSTIYAKGCRAGYQDSLVATENFTTTGTIGNISFTPPGGLFTSPTNVSLVPGSPYPSGTIIRYTTSELDTPTCSSGSVWSGPLNVTGPIVLRAIACKGSPEWIPSAVFEAAYNVINPALCDVGNPSIHAGTGTALDPYLICNVDQLQAINATDLSAHYYQVANIDATVTSTWNSGAGFLPIGFTPHFSGYYNGMGNAISNLTINRNTQAGIGLFGRLTGSAVVENIRLVNCNITGNNLVGAVAGQIFNNSIVRRVSSNCIIVGTTQNVGGLVGDCRTGSAIQRSFSAGTVSGVTFQIGGLVGSTFGISIGNSCEISDSYTITTVSGGSSSRAGFVGTYCSGCRIINSYASNFSPLPVGYSGFTGTGDNSNLFNSYWNTTSSLIFTSPAGYPRTKDQLECPTTAGETCEGQTTYPGWSEEIWNFGTDTDLPCLRGVTPGCS